METLPNPPRAHVPPPSSTTQPDPPPLRLNTAKQTQYFLRCLKTLLPHHYQSNDSQRLSFAFFTLSALDLLGVLHEKITPQEREGYAEWIYGLQHPGGGFKGFTGSDVGERCEQEEANVWDPANLGSTFFALGCLMVLGDGMERVRWREGLEWLRGLQRVEGNFGEAVGKGAVVEGGGDVRFCYLASGVRWMLRRGAEAEVLKDVDVEAVVRFIRRSVTYDGGISETPGGEAHAGETFCGIAALKLLGRLPSDTARIGHVSPVTAMGPDVLEKVTRWLVFRQTLQLDEKEEDEEDNDEEQAEVKFELLAGTPKVLPPTYHVQGTHPAKLKKARPPPVRPTSIEAPPGRLHWAGFNGRCNKAADTCYAWWVNGSLGMLNKVHLQNFNALERYLLDKTQHAIGGFGKMPGDPPDILHSYLGLAALAVMRHPDLKSLDPALCMSMSAKENFERNTTLGRGEQLSVSAEENR